MRWLGYIWRVIVNLFYLVVVAAVLIGISNPMEKAIISVLGILYVTIRSVGIGTAMGMTGMALSLQHQIDAIRYAVDNSFEIPDGQDETEAVEFMRNKLYIDAFFQGLISLGCLWAFFTAHNGSY